MDKFKFILFSIIALVLVGLLGYWAIMTMQSGSEHVSIQKIKTLQNENEELTKEVKDLKDQLAILQPKVIEEPVVEQPVVEEPVVPVKKPAPKTVYKNQTLINELQKLINDNVLLKLKSAGTRVGTVQKFLNLYNKTSNRIDNDYGASTKAAVAAFQKAVGLKADGEAGASTFSKMIAWLKKQG